MVDLGSLDTPEEQAVIAESVLDTLWRQRRDRRPVLIVIDEAHNVCPQNPESGIVALATRHAMQIAAEGRKFGLHLLVSTQRPQKLHDNVLSQCDNLVLMRMNSAADLAHLIESFSFVPPSMFNEARHFGLGEAMVAGKFSPHPTLVRFGARISEEGGADVRAGRYRPRLTTSSVLRTAVDADGLVLIGSDEAVRPLPCPISLPVEEVVLLVDQKALGIDSRNSNP